MNIKLKTDICVHKNLLPKALFEFLRLTEEFVTIGTFISIFVC